MRKFVTLTLSSVFAIVLGIGVLSVATNAFTKIKNEKTSSNEDAYLVTIEKPIPIQITNTPEEIPAVPEIITPPKEAVTTENRIEDAQKILCDKPKDTTPDWSLHSVGRVEMLGNYVPNELTDIRDSVSTIGNKLICLTTVTKTALEDLKTEIENNKLEIITVSGYRSRTYQKTLFDAWRKQFTVTPPYFAVAEPEHSEHQLGTTVDLMSGTQSNADFETFGDSDEYLWMTEHAYEFGFVQSYTKGTEEITGYIEEPWHWRYVGVDIATEIKESGTTLTEYLKENEKPSP